MASETETVQKSNRPASATLHIVRHGENPANIRREFSSKVVDYDLTKRGIHQSLVTAEWLATFGIRYVFSSPMRRARTTASFIAARVGADVTNVDSLREIDVGELEGQSTAENWALHNDILDDWQAGNWGRAFPGGENFLTLTKRVYNALCSIVRLTSNSEVAVITHGGVILAIRHGICGERGVLDAPNCSVMVVSATNSESGSTSFDLLCPPQFGHLDGSRHIK